MSAVRISPPRILLFVPASRPDMIARTSRCRPDIVVVDLEDAVAAAAKDSARGGGAADAEAGSAIGYVGKGVGLVDGTMTDEVHVRWARQILQRAEHRTEDR